MKPLRIIPLILPLFLGCGNDTAEDSTDAFADVGEGEESNDGEMGSDEGAMLRALEAIDAEGNRIGYVQGVGEYTIRVWDDANNFLFDVNDTTGFVANNTILYYGAENCGGFVYVESPVNADGACIDAISPRQAVWANGGDRHGLTEGYEMSIATGEPQSVELQALLLPGKEECSPVASSFSCVRLTAATTTIPTSFPPPLSIVEAEF